MFEINELFTLFLGSVRALKSGSIHIAKRKMEYDSSNLERREWRREVMRILLHYYLILRSLLISFFD